MTVNPNSLKNLQAMPRLGDEPLAPKPLCVKLPADIYALVEPMENRSEWLRRVICEAAARELMEPSTRMGEGERSGSGSGSVCDSSR